MNKVLELERPEIKIKIDSIKLVDVNKLKLNPENRNHHPQEQIDELARHYAVHGMRTPIIVSNLSGHIVSGNGRFLAAKRAGLNELPVSYQDFESPEKEYAFGIADNGLSLWSELDFTLINEDITDFGPDFNIDDLGLKDFTIDVADKYEDKDADEIPEVLEPKAKLGEIYKLGNHRLMCGDSTDIATVEKLMNGEKADLGFCDPPYNLGFEYNEYDDNKSDDEYKNFSHKWFENLVKFSERQAVTLGTKNIPIMSNLGAVSGVACWVKKNWITSCHIAKLQQWEPIFFYDDYTKFKRTSDLFEINRVVQKDVGDNHSCPKQIELIVDIFKHYSKYSVIDLFAGSGTTMIACEKLGLKSYGIELDPHYIDVIIARWEKFTGQKAELINV